MPFPTEINLSNKDNLLKSSTILSNDGSVTFPFSISFACFFNSSSFSTLDL